MLRGKLLQFTNHLMLILFRFEKFVRDDKTFCLGSIYTAFFQKSIIRIEIGSRKIITNNEGICSVHKVIIQLLRKIILFNRRLHFSHLLTQIQKQLFGYRLLWNAEFKLFDHHFTVFIGFEAKRRRFATADFERWKFCLGENHLMLFQPADVLSITLLHITIGGPYFSKSVFTTLLNSIGPVLRHWFLFPPQFLAIQDFSERNLPFSD